MRTTTSRAPLLQVARRLDLGRLQRLAVEEDDAFEADTEETSGPRPSSRSSVQQFLHLEDLTAKGRQALTSVNVQLLQLLRAFVYRRMEQLALLLLFDREKREKDGLRNATSSVAARKQVMLC